jgi:hypothetical protein
MANVDEKVSKMTATKKIRIYHRFLKLNTGCWLIFLFKFSHDQKTIDDKLVPKNVKEILQLVLILHSPGKNGKMRNGNDESRHWIRHGGRSRKSAFVRPVGFLLGLVAKLQEQRMDLLFDGAIPLPM